MKPIAAQKRLILPLSALTLAAALLTFLAPRVGATGYDRQSGMPQPTAEASLQPSAAPESSPSPQAAPSPSRAPKPSIAPTAHPVERRGGPLQFVISGSLGLGTQLSQSNLANPISGLNGSTALNQTSETAGLYTTLRRRTLDTTTELQLPLGLSNRGSQFGTARLSYSTPRYTLSYGAQSLGIFGQVPVGQTQRGLDLTLPAPGGDLTMFGGPALGVAGDMVRLAGIRLRRVFGSAFGEIGLSQSTGGPNTGPTTTFLLGLSKGSFSRAFVGEAALQSRRSPSGPTGGLAFQARFDEGLSSPNGYTLTFRHMPARFLSYGGGESPADDYGDFSWRLIRGQRNAFGDISMETTVVGGVVSVQRRSSLSFSMPIHHDSLQVGFQDQRLGGNGNPQWLGTGTLQLGAPLHDGLALFGFQAQRTTAAATGPLAMVSYSVQASRNIGLWALQFTAQRQRQSGGYVGPVRTTLGTLGILRGFGKTTIGATYSITRTQSALTNAIQRTPLLTISRQISPVISIQSSLGYQSIVDTLNPSADGRSRIVSVELNAPFSFGNGAVLGRVDPRLPAIITGQVLTDYGPYSGQGFQNTGVGNVLVLLDRKIAQRTDLEGNFQFSFVQPGEHQITIESSSLPRGLTADQPVITLDVEGGQTGQAIFRVGNYGSIQGRVLGRSSGGLDMPLSNVMVRVDNGAYSQTDAEGTFGFGRLSPGPHTVTVMENTVPAFASFPKAAREQKVVVKNGHITRVDFVAEPLGSIAGFVTYKPSLAPKYKGGVNNAYVVAEPGEHAAITNPDGSFLIADLPPGIYTLSVDPETVPNNTGPQGPPVNVTLKAHENYHGLHFIIGHKIKKVVFTLLDGATPPPTITLDLGEPRLPPQGSTVVHVEAPLGATKVVLKAFGKDVPLKRKGRTQHWEGVLVVPTGQKGGRYEVTALATGTSTQRARAAILVDPKLPLAILQVYPPHAASGQYAAIRARFFVVAHAGDKIEWQDGRTTTLTRPSAGGIFTFSLRISLRPFDGVLVTKTARVPILLP